MIKKLLLIILLSSLSGLAIASSVEHDYRAALNSALKNRLEDAEKQFADILSQNPGHSRASVGVYSVKICVRNTDDCHHRDEVQCSKF